MTKWRKTGKGVAARSTPALPQQLPASASKQAKKQFAAEFSEFLRAHSKGSSFESTSQLIEIEAVNVFESPDVSNKSDAKNCAELVGKYCRFARVARDEGNFDRAVGWAMKAQCEYDLMVAVLRTGQEAREKRSNGEKTKRNEAVKRGWIEEADRIQNEHPGLSRTEIARRLIRRFNLQDAQLRTVQDCLKAEGIPKKS